MAPAGAGAEAEAPRARSRSRSRSRGRCPDEVPCADAAADAAAEGEAASGEGGAGGGFAALMRQAMCRKLGLEPDASESELLERQAASAGPPVPQLIGPAPPPQGRKLEAQQPAALPLRSSFASEEEFEAHLRANPVLLADRWQAAVRASSSRSGAGWMLWCPACADADGAAWSTPAARAGNLLRHAVTRGVGTSSKAGPYLHRRFASALVELALQSSSSPEEKSLRPTLRQEDGGDGSAPLGLEDLAAPLLAAQSPDGGAAVRQVQDAILGSDPHASMLLLPAVTAAAAAAEQAAAEAAADSDQEEEMDAEGKMALRILGRDLTVQGNGLYDEEIPLEGSSTDGPGGVVVAEEVPEGAILASCPLPSGGVSSLVSFDLTVSSDEETSAAAAAAPAAAAAAAPVKAVAGAPVGQVFV